jgi:hypothetical protein
MANHNYRLHHELLQRNDQLQRSIHDLRSYHQDEMEEILVEHDQALQRMRDMDARDCAVVSQQQKIISRGAAIIKERDTEIQRLTRELSKSQVDGRNEQKERERCAKQLIERLTQELSKSQASYRNEQQERGRCANLLAEKTDETVELRKALTKALTPNLPRGSRNHNDGLGLDQLQTREKPTVSPFATPLGRRTSSMQWTPQEIPQLSRLPHEVQRAHVWNSGNVVAHDNLRFGEPGQISSSLREHVDREARRNDSLRLLENLVIAGDAERKPALALQHQDSDRSMHVDGDAGYHGSPARKSSSMADVRSRNGDRVYLQETGLRQQTGHDAVPRSRLQAYVEAVESSGGEQRGDAA